MTVQTPPHLTPRPDPTTPPPHHANSTEAVGRLRLTFLGRVNDLHTWQFPTGRLTDLDKIKSPDLSSVAMLYRRGGHWVWRGQHIMQHESQTNKETPSWAVPHSEFSFCQCTWTHTTSYMGSMFICWVLHHNLLVIFHFEARPPQVIRYPSITPEPVLKQRKCQNCFFHFLPHLTISVPP